MRLAVSIEHAGSLRRFRRQRNPCRVTQQPLVHLSERAPGLDHAPAEPGTCRPRVYRPRRFLRPYTHATRVKAMVEIEQRSDESAVARGLSVGTILVALFAASGCAALIYEIVWFHLLRLVIGASALSLGIVLASFMGGMFLGSLLLPRVVPREWHPLRVYGAIEMGIGALGILM